MRGLHSKLTRPADVDRLIRHIESHHRSLLDPVVGGPLDDSRLTQLRPDVLLAIHQANHMVPWAEHGVDDWRSSRPDPGADPKPDPTPDPDLWDMNLTNSGRWDEDWG
jgi:hypothetical protein